MDVVKVMRRLRVRVSQNNYIERSNVLTGNAEAAPVSGGGLLLTVQPLSRLKLRLITAILESDSEVLKKSSIASPSLWLGSGYRLFAAAIRGTIRPTRLSIWRS